MTIVARFCPGKNTPSFDTGLVSGNIDEAVAKIIKDLLQAKLVCAEPLALIESAQGYLSPPAARAEE